MTITTNPARNEYTSSAAQTVFNYTFRIYIGTDLNVYVTPVGQVANDATDITTAYTVDPNTIGDEAGGFITFTSPLNSGDLVTIVSSIPTDRTVDYQTNGDFIPPTVNADIDRAVSLVKQVENLATRTVQFEESQQSASGITLPAPSPGEVMIWNVAGDGFENDDGTGLMGIAQAVTDSEAARDAAEASSTAASDSADAAAQSLEDFNDKYYGALASNPALAPSGAAMTAGDLYFNSTNNVMREYTGVAWQDVGTSDEFNFSKRANTNGSFDVWQEGTSMPLAAGYFADQWEMINIGGATGTVSQGVFAIGQSDVSGNPKHYLNIEKTNTGATPDVVSPVEGVERFSGEAVTLLFTAKASVGAQTLRPKLVQQFGTGGSPSSSVSTNSAEGDITLTTSWQEFTATFVLPSISGKVLGTDSNDHLQIRLDLPVDVIYDVQIAEVKLGGKIKNSYPDELEACKRFLRVSDGVKIAQYVSSASGAQMLADIDFGAPMRDTPTVTQTTTDFTVGVVTATPSSIIWKCTDNNSADIKQITSWKADARL